MDEAMLLATVAFPSLLAWDGFRRWLGRQTDDLRTRLAAVEGRQEAYEGVLMEVQSMATKAKKDASTASAKVGLDRQQQRGRR